VYAASWRGKDAVVKIIQYVSPPGLPLILARESRARANTAFRREAELQAGLHRLGAGLTVDAWAASCSNTDETGSVDYAIVMPRMLPLPPLSSLTLAQRKSMLRDLSGTIATLHALPEGSWGMLLHRDIKLANLLLDKPLKDGGRVHLGDFGEALLRTGVTMPAGRGVVDMSLRGPHGTPGYMDPALWVADSVPSRVRASEFVNV
jgi:serine/threonine protein kinase